MVVRRVTACTMNRAAHLCNSESRVGHAVCRLSELSSGTAVIDQAQFSVQKVH
jgi:hypothetical protein